jgi:L-ascorbate metabolism protein UlaG (beta-lactamase superfamily)
MSQTSGRGITLAMAALLLAAVAGVRGQDRVPLKDKDLERYRPYFLKDADGTPKDGAVKVTFFGTTTLLFDDGETQLMTDGFFTRPSLITVARGKLETDTKIVDAVLKKAKIDRLQALFVAHSHYDHALDAAYVAKTTKAKLHGSASTLNIGRGGGLGDEQMVLFEPGKEQAVGKFKVTVLKGKHSPPIKGINDDLGQTIDKPLKQPATARDYKEGGSFDFLIKHGDRAILVIPSGNYVEGALDKVRADVLFLGTGGVGKQTREFQTNLYDNTVKKVQPRLVIPVHWDNFFTPLSDRLEPPGKLIDDAPAAFDFLIERLKADKIQFGILQGYNSVMLFGKDAKDAPPGKKEK